MNLQYISDNTGQTTGVYIPIQEWNELKSKYKGIADEEVNLPGWHIETVRKRLATDEQPLDFNSAMDDIERNL